jgi:hypothetical protein
MPLSLAYAGNDLRIGSFAGRFHLGASSHTFCAMLLFLQPSFTHLLVDSSNRVDAEIEL